VVVGWDIQCCEDEEWVAANGGPALRKDQPFYHVVVDERDWEYDAYQVRWGIQELCICGQQEDIGKYNS
jgi:hemimethylated DNA binding protein